MTVAESMAGMSGVFHFLTSDTESSLFRNDLVRMTRDDRGNFVESEGVSTEPFELSVNNARELPRSESMTLDKNGFELIESPVKDYDFLDHQTL